MAVIEEGLKWTTEIVYGPTHSGADWITVDPAQGTGTTAVTITITPTQIHGDSDTAGTVTFKCDEDCSPPLEKRVEVTRCTPDCEYESQGTTTYTFQTKRVGKCDVSADFDVPYVITYQPTVQGCIARQEQGFETIHENFSVNNTSNERIVKEVSGKYKIIQDAGPCNCIYEKTSFLWDDVPNETAEKCEKEKIVTITGKAITSFTNCDSIVSPVTATEKCEFGENDTNEVKRHTFTYQSTGVESNIATITITQAAGPCHTCPEYCITADKPATCDVGTVVFTATEGPCGSETEQCPEYNITITNEETLTCEGGLINFTANKVVNSPQEGDNPTPNI